MNYEETVIGIIAHSGNAHSCAMEAIGKAKTGAFEEAEGLLAEAHSSLTEAQKIHGELLSEDAAGEGPGVTLLTVHAEDQIMAAFSAIDMAREFIEIYQVVLDLKNGVVKA